MKKFQWLDLMVDLKAAKYEKKSFNLACKVDSVQVKVQCFSFFWDSDISILLHTT